MRSEPSLAFGGEVPAQPALFMMQRFVEDQRIGYRRSKSFQQASAVAAPPPFRCSRTFPFRRPFCKKFAFHGPELSKVPVADDIPCWIVPSCMRS